MIRRRCIQLGLCALVASAAAACGGAVELESQHEQKVADGEAALLALAASAAHQTPYAGLRRVEALVESGGETTSLAYRESVVADGTGRFAVETVEVLSFLADPALFQLLQETREGFLFRYRDFAVRDLATFTANYAAVDLDQETLVAGRACQELVIQRASGAGPRWHVALDQATGLVLRAAEVDARGAVLSSMEFETFDPEPDLADVAWFTPDAPETPLDPYSALTPQAGFEVFEPGVLPDGYGPWKAALLTDAEEKVWIKQVFTDGVQPLFFFHREAPADGGGAVLHGGSTASMPVAAGAGHDAVQVYRMGRTHVVQGVLRGREVVALGRVADEALLDLLESAID